MHTAAPKQAADESNASYTCPMHPEVLRNAPGDCPLCGMALVAIAGTGKADDSELRDLTRRLWIGVALSIPLVILAMSPMVGLKDPLGLMPRARGWVEFVLGSPVVLWGEGLPIDDVASAAATVGYELMCGLAPRVPIVTTEVGRVDLEL